MFNIHAHTINHNPGSTILNCSMPSLPSAIADPSCYISLSLHPWYLDKQNAQAQIEWIEQSINNPQVVAIGEAGIDKLCPVDMELQTSVFIKVIALSEQYQLPLIIHAVKSYNEIVCLRKKLHAVQPWIIHGFRGKAELMKMLTKHGLYLSYGEKYNDIAFKETPIERMFIETDDKQLRLDELYAQGAALKGLSQPEFIKRITENVKRIFKI